MSGRLIEEDLFTKYSIVDNNLPEGQRVHDFLQARARALAGRYIDFDKTPVTFVISDDDAPNAFYAPPPNPDEDRNRRRNEYSTTRSIQNPVDTPVICVTRGLIEMVDNLDQLDFVLGHELTHMIMRQHEVEHNSKGEEEIADLHSVDLMYDAGADPKQALVMSQKLSAYGAEQRKKYRRKRYGADKEEEEGIIWSDIFDVHMTDDNRQAGVEASLTRLSHLIDDLTPTEIDKEIFSARYNDPIDEFLKAHSFDTLKPLGQLKVLVDCIDHLAAPVDAEEYFSTAIANLPRGESLSLNYDSARKLEKLQESVDAGYTDYYRGPVIEKKYQQKIANLAEAIFDKVEAEREYKGTETKPAAINTKDLRVYLHNKAFSHLDGHGYPEEGDHNYLDASGVMYSYFDCLFNKGDPEYGRMRRWNDEEEPHTDTTLSLMDIAILSAKESLQGVSTAAEFTAAVETFDRLVKIKKNFLETSYGTGYRKDKFDNLSPVGGIGDSSHDKDVAYDLPLEAGVVPWQNLVELARADESIKGDVIAFLKNNAVEDFRLTHNLPYIRTTSRECSTVDETGMVSGEKVQNYDVDNAAHRADVLETYGYIKEYFESEADIIDQTCASAVYLEESDYTSFASVEDQRDDNTIAQKKLYDFVSMYNALPDDESEEVERYREDRSAIAMIPARYKTDHPVPNFIERSSGWSRGPVFEYDSKLLLFSNPVFQDHFGEDYQATLDARKDAQAQQMFDTAKTLLEQSIESYAELRPVVDDLGERVDSLRREIWDKEDSPEPEDKAIVATRKAELEPLKAEFDRVKKRLDTSESFLYNLLSGVSNPSDSPWTLQKLTENQRVELARIAMRDEKGAIRRLMRDGRYEHFCDYLGVMEAQTKRVVDGDYTWTEDIKVVAANQGYAPAKSNEEFVAFVAENQDSRYSQDHQSYAWNLCVFDMLQHLQTSSEINVNALAVAVTQIEKEGRSSNGADNPDIVNARYSNYKNLINSDEFLDSIGEAVDHQENYEGLSVEELCLTADNLIDVRKQIEKVFKAQGSSDAYYGASREKQLSYQQKQHLELFDRNIRGAIVRAEELALQIDNPLAKIEALYRVYHQEQREFSSRDSRESYTKTLGEKEGRLKAIAELSHDESFWPEDVLDHVKAYVYAKNTFLDDKELENTVLNNILDKLENLPGGKKKNECLFVLLDKNLRAAYPDTRDRLFSIYTDDVKSKIGKDDGSEKYQRRLQVYLKALEGGEERGWDIGKKHHARDGLLSNSISAADKYLLLRGLSDAVVSQEQTSQMMKEACQVKLNSEDMMKSYLYGIGVDYLTEEMDDDPDMADRFIQFLNSKGERKDCSDISTYIEKKLRAKYQNSGWAGRLDKILENTKPINCEILYENFWAAPLEARSVIVARMLKSAVSKDDHVQDGTQQSWESVFDVVMDNIIRADDDLVEAIYARDIMHSYIKSRSDYERVLILSAMMVANRNIGEDIGNVGKALKLFLENMGPAEIKLGQAIASHPNTPDSIKRELQELKNAADMPARWTLYDWIRAENIPEEYWKDIPLGEILGSASYYTTVSLGEDKVLRILRPEAREKATKGFKVIRATVADLDEKEATSDVSYAELTSSVQEMVIQAANMSEVETDHNAGQKQYEYAKEIYDGVEIKCGGETFTFKVMDWRAKGQNWIVMDKAHGPTFNDMPEDTSEQLLYKKRFAKGYVAFELKNIFSGRKFDHDKHGAQLSINPETNEVGIYDTGAMALEEPSREDQRLLGNIIYKVVKAKRAGEDVVPSFSRIVSEKIEERHSAGLDTRYLVEVKKGLLALGDFFKALEEDDIKDILRSIDFSNDLSADVQKGVAENMSVLEKAQFHAFSVVSTASDAGDISIRKRDIPDKCAIGVVDVDVDPETILKSSWLRDAFSKPDGKAKEGKDADPFHARLSAGQRKDDLSITP